MSENERAGVRQESLHILSLVCRQIVEHDMDLLRPASLRYKSFQKRNELVTNMSSGGHTVHLARLHIQRCIPGQCASAEILEALPLGSPRTKRQDGIQRVKSLGGRLLIYAEHRRMLRR